LFIYQTFSTTVDSNSRDTEIFDFNSNEYPMQGKVLEIDNTEVSAGFVDYTKTSPHKYGFTVSNTTTSNQKVNAKYVILYITI
jgi:hypothetical protein